MDACHHNANGCDSLPGNKAKKVNNKMKGGGMMRTGAQQSGKLNFPKKYF